MEETVEHGNQFLDELEFDDYLENKGQWTTRLVTDNKPDL